MSLCCSEHDNETLARCPKRKTDVPANNLESSEHACNSPKEHREEQLFAFCGRPVPGGNGDLQKQLASSLVCCSPLGASRVSPWVGRHKAERKKAIMRKEARARILGKRAAAAMQASRAGGGRGGAARGAKARVFRRAKRDCRVTDARRQKLAAYIFCGKEQHEQRCCW